MAIKEAVRAWSQQRGYRWAAAPFALLADVRLSLQRRWEAGEIDAAFYRDNLRSLTYLSRCPLEDPKSVLLIAVPRPAHTLSFTLGGRTIETVLPPTYVRYRKTFEDVRDDLEDAVADLRGRLVILDAPLKALGNRMGLLWHGRNNIGYVDGLGSYVQLVGLVTDLLVHEGSAPPRSEEVLLARCEKCRICAAACSTGAIDEGRVLLRAEKCYTLFSESLQPIPAGLEPPSARCLIGCLRCQEVCPENKGRLRYETTGVSFTAPETEAFLALASGSERGLDQAQAKLRELGLSEDAPLYARNLMVLPEIRAIIECL